MKPMNTIEYIEKLVNEKLEMLEEIILLRQENERLKRELEELKSSNEN